MDIYKQVNNINEYDKYISCVNKALALYSCNIDNDYQLNSDINGDKYSNIDGNNINRNVDSNMDSSNGICYCKWKHIKILSALNAWIFDAWITHFKIGSNVFMFHDVKKPLKNLYEYEYSKMKVSCKNKNIKLPIKKYLYVDDKVFNKMIKQHDFKSKRPAAFGTSCIPVDN